MIVKLTATSRLSINNNIKPWMRVIAFIIGSIVTVIVAMNLAVFLEFDRCADAGGRYIDATGACLIDGNKYVALFSRTGAYAFWCVFLGISFMSGWFIYRVVLFLCSHFLGVKRLSVSH